MEYENYLTKYGKVFNVIVNEDKCNIILCKNGSIDLYSLQNKELVYFHFGTKKQLTHISKNIHKRHGKKKFKVEFGNDEGKAIFPEFILNDITDILKVKKRRVYTREQIYMINKKKAKIA